MSSVFVLTLSEPDLGQLLVAYDLEAPPLTNHIPSQVIGHHNYKLKMLLQYLGVVHPNLPGAMGAMGDLEDGDPFP